MVRPEENSKGEVGGRGGCDVSARRGMDFGKICRGRVLPQVGRVMLSGSKIYRRRNGEWGV